MLGEPYSPTDNVPMEWWITKQGTHARDRMSFSHFKYLLINLVKFATVCALDMQNTMSPDEVVDEWLALTFKKGEY